MIDFNRNIKDILDERPELTDFFAANISENVKNPEMLKITGARLSLKDAINSVGLNEEAFRKKLEDYLNAVKSKEDRSLRKSNDAENADIRFSGVLPCPIKIPLEDALEKFGEKLEKDEGIKVNFDLKSANLGLEHVREIFEEPSADSAPDLITGAGFELFFDERIKRTVLECDDYSASDQNINMDFKRAGVDLADPEFKYKILGVVPAVFVINDAACGEKRAPESWEELLSGDYPQSLAIPKGDLDLYNAILLTVYSRFGESGIKALKKSVYKSLHPSMMVRSSKASGLAQVGIAPYFFADMINEASGLRAVWPKDGAVISPIFMICKEKKPIVSHLAKFLNSKEVGEIFSAGGKFPSTNPAVENFMKEDMKFIWAGWDMIYSHDVGEVLRDLTRLMEV